MALESLPKIAPALFSADQDLIQIYNKKSDTTGVINPSYIKSSPSGVSGAIQFSNGSAFASDAANLFWDNTNKRLGIGLNTPVAGPFQVKTTQSNANGSIIFTNNTTATILAATDTGSALTQLQFRASSYNFTDTAGMRIASTGYATTPTAMLQIVGSGSTSVTTSLLVQNSGGSTAMQVQDDLSCTLNSGNSGAVKFSLGANSLNINFIANNSGWGLIAGGGVRHYISSAEAARLDQNGAWVVGKGSNADASAITELTSTTKGFLPPRQNLAQRTAIVSPAVGLMVYQTDGTEGLYVYKSTGWQFVA